MTLLSVLPGPAREQSGAAPAAIKLRVRNVRRWRLWFSRWIYEVTGPRHALLCFATHVEAMSAPSVKPATSGETRVPEEKFHLFSCNYMIHELIGAADYITDSRMPGDFIEIQLIQHLRGHLNDDVGIPFFWMRLDT